MIQTAAHETKIERDIMELPSPDAWARFAPTNNAWVTCTCGLDTGVVHIETAKQVFNEHRNAHTSA